MTRSLRVLTDMARLDEPIRSLRERAIRWRSRRCSSSESRGFPLVPEYLNLGSVVVVAPDQETLRRWVREQDGDREPPAGRDAEPLGTVVDPQGATHRRRWSHASVERSRIPSLERFALAPRSRDLVPRAPCIVLGRLAGAPRRYLLGESARAATESQATGGRCAPDRRGDPWLRVPRGALEGEPRIRESSGTKVGLTQPETN
jgi:hypothetical protein